MARTEIPARVEIRCDICGVECDSRAFVGTKGSRRHNATLVMKRDALDWLGDPAADGTVSYDLCDTCHTAVCDAINATSKKIREERGDDA